MQSIDEEKIQEYLDKQGITSVDDPGIRKVIHYFHALTLISGQCSNVISDNATKEQAQNEQEA